MRCQRLSIACAVLSILAARFCVHGVDGAEPAKPAQQASAAATSGERSSSAAPAAPSPAASLVRKALVAEADGKPDERAALLKQALAADANYAPAHWHSGEVQIDDRWLPVDKAAEQTARDGKMDEYRRLRDEGTDTLRNHVKMARWCAEAGLQAQERAHLLFAFGHSPNSRELAAKMGLVKHHGMLVPAARVAEIKQGQKDYDAATRRWLQRIDKLSAEIRSESRARRRAAEDKLLAVDPAAIPALESLSANNGPLFADAVVASLAHMTGQEATDALVRQAICSPYFGARDSAAEALKSRSLYTYVPTLMSILRPPIYVQFETYFLAGSADSRHRLVMFQEGPLARQALISTGGASQQLSVVEHPISKKPADISLTDHPDLTLGEDLSLAHEAQAYNQRIAMWNDRAIDALQTATGQTIDDQPSLWWDWWLGYNEIYQPPVKPTSIVSRDVIPPPSTYFHTNVSCFVAGTKVWTTTGPMPIETLKVGECVLAQDPATGELAYKPVLATTVRPRSPVIAVRISGDKIFATRGHPFWVSGKGWQMTKELEAGDWLHAADGPIEIASVEDGGNEVCYNMVVADFGTYFVGERKVLVHDNNIRDVTPATVPGLVAP